MIAITTSGWSVTDTVALASILTAIAALGALVIGISQAKGMREGWQAQNALEVLRDLQSEIQRNGRREIYSLKGQEVPYSQWGEEKKRIADSICSQLNAVAYLDKRRLLPPGMVEDNWGNVYRNVYTAAHDHILDRRAKGDSKLWEPFIGLAEKYLTISPADNFYP
jgi:hypothetical protein